MSDAANPFGFDNADGKASESSDVFRPIALAYPAAVFIIVPVDDIMAAIFYGPMETIDVQDALWISVFWCPAGNAIGDVFGIFAGFFVYGFSFDDKSLSDMREVEEVIQFCGRPDFSGFDPAVIWWIASNEIGLAAVFEEK